MKKMIVKLVIVAGGVWSLTGCGQIVGSMVKAAQTKHDASVCNGIKGKSQVEVEKLFETKPSQAIEDEHGNTIASYEQGNFGAVIHYDKDGKVTRQYCGGIGMAQLYLRKQTGTEPVPHKIQSANEGR